MVISTQLDTSDLVVIYGESSAQVGTPGTPKVEHGKRCIDGTTGRREVLKAILSPQEYRELKTQAHQPVQQT